MKTTIYFAVIIFSVFHFSSCQKATPAPSANVDHSNDYWQPDDLSGTKWRIYQYKLDGTSNIFAINDTLIFSSSSNYTYNGYAFEYYLARTSQGADHYMLNLSDTPFGTLTGYPPNQFKTYGVMNGIQFTVLSSGTEQIYDLWLEKI